MLEVTTVLDSPKAAVQSVLPGLVPALKRDGEAILVELTRHEIELLAARPANGARLDQASQRWYPAFAGNVELDQLPTERTHIKIKGIIIPGMGPFEDRRWERSVVNEALTELARILQRYFAHTGRAVSRDGVAR